MKEKINEFMSLISNHGYYGRLGKLFETDNNYYLLDTGTGKVAQIDKYMRDVLACVFESNDPMTTLKALPDTCEYNKALDEIIEGIEKEHILSAPEVKTLTGDAVKYLDQIVEDGLQNVTLEVTEACNLRCKYCIYNESHTEYREFGEKMMPWEVAKGAIDYLEAHSKQSDKVHIGFYGGEPLLNFKLIEDSVKYAKSIFDREIDFAMTTNATLVTDRIAEFLAENEINLIISWDGPKSLHDANRVYADGTGSFSNTVEGAKKLIESYKKRGITEKIGFNIVVTGPDYEKEYDMIQNYIDASNWLPKEVLYMTSSVDYGPKDSEYIKPQTLEDIEYMENVYEPNYGWERKKRRESEVKNGLFVDSSIDKGMLAIHKRLLLDKPTSSFGMNGCCVPGQRRIYVTTDGRFLLCEKVGNIPDIGNVDTGIDVEKIREVYVEDFIKGALPYCKDCWAVNLCSLCYVNCYDENGTHFAYRHRSCQSERKYIEENLVRYHGIMETDPESLRHYNDIEIE